MSRKRPSLSQAIARIQQQFDDYFAAERERCARNLTAYAEKLPEQQPAPEEQPRNPKRKAVHAKK
jgi:hypothetical protein